MKRAVYNARELLAAAIMLIGVLIALNHCSSQQTTPALAESTYLAQQLECVDKSMTRAESEECRRDVRKRWGIVETVTDGGAR